MAEARASISSRRSTRARSSAGLAADDAVTELVLAVDDMAAHAAHAGDAGGAAAAEQIISVNGALWTPGPFAQFACCAVSWIVLLQATVQVVGAVVFVTTQEIHDGK